MPGNSEILYFLDAEGNRSDQFFIDPDQRTTKSLLHVLKLVSVDAGLLPAMCYQLSLHHPVHVTVSQLLSLAYPDQRVAPPP